MFMPRHHIVGTSCFLLGPLMGCASESGLVGKDDKVHDPVRVEETFLQEPEAKVDILWVIDDTSSMTDEHVALQDAFGVFAEALGELGLAWQMGVVTTDVSDDEAGVLRGDPWILTPGLDGLAEALQGAAAVGTEGASPESGLGAAVLALSEPLLSGENRAFRRVDAALHVVVVSDSDDESEAVLGEDPAQAATAFMAAETARTGREARLSAIVGDPVVGCTWEGGSAEPGDRYQAVAEATGGTTASICDADLSGVATALGERSASWPTRFALQARPDPDSARVWLDDVRLQEGFSVEADPPELVFDEAPTAGAEIRVSYELYE